MTAEPIRSHRNPRVAEAVKLHRGRERRSLGRTLIEGPNLLTEAIESTVLPEVLFATSDDEATHAKAAIHDVELILVTPGVLKHLAGTETPRGPIGVVRIPEPAGRNGAGLLVSWGVGDPGNVGTLVRTAAAFGWDFAYLEGSADPWSPKVLRAGAGMQFRIAISPITDISELANAGYEVLASVVTGGVSPASLSFGRYALLIGEEASGLPANVVAKCHGAVSIEMPGGTESLNAGVAAGILVYELMKGEGQGAARV